MRQLPAADLIAAPVPRSGTAEPSKAGPGGGRRLAIRRHRSWNIAPK